MSAIVTADFVQKSVDATNRLIAGDNNIDWSKLRGLTPQQLQAAQVLDAKQYQAEEDGIIAMSSHMGVTGVNLTFTQIKWQAGLEDGASPGADNTPTLISQKSGDNPSVLPGSLSEAATPATAAPTPKAPTDLPKAVSGQPRPIPSGANVTVGLANPANNHLTSADAALALLTAAQQQSKHSAGASSDLREADLYV